jgi:hypothetical protein
MKKNKTNPGYQAVTDGDLRRPMGLSDFMNGLGLVMRLPQKRPPTPEPVTAVVVEPEKPRTPRSKVVVISMTMFVVTTLGILASAVVPERNDPLPAQLTGRWQAISPRYAGRALEFRDGALFIKRGPEDSDIVRLRIQRVVVRPQNSSQRVAIEYLEDGAPVTLNLLLHDYGGMAMVELQNLPDVVWRKATAASPNGPLPTQPAAIAR